MLSQFTGHSPVSQLRLQMRQSKQKRIYLGKVQELAVVATGPGLHSNLASWATNGLTQTPI